MISISIERKYLIPDSPFCDGDEKCVHIKKKDEYKGKDIFKCKIFRTLLVSSGNGTKKCASCLYLTVHRHYLIDYTNKEITS
jgi:hypothetical protein